MNIFALDIGGAFIKSAFIPARGRAQRNIIPFEMWKRSERLSDLLCSLRPKREIHRCAITMTGELCDCFRNRREGVRHIVGAAEKVFRGCRVFTLRGTLLHPSRAIRCSSDVASANWAIPPLWISRFARDFLLVDIGSTTTDLTPIRKGKIANRGWTDFSRMQNGELLYTGFLRTGVQAVVQTVRVREKVMPLSSETFSQMGDLYLLLKNISPKQYLSHTPDGKGTTPAAARRRLSRCLLADEGELGMEEVHDIAQQVANAQAGRIVRAAKRFRLPLIVIGTGAFILKKALRSGELPLHPLAPRFTSLDPSLALAHLLQEGFA